MRVFFMSGLLFICMFAHAEVAVIVHPSNSVVLQQNDIVRLYLGKAKSFPDGSQAVPINLIASVPTAEEFSKKALKKSSEQLRAYWSRLVFTGKGSPPQEVESESQMLELVANNPNFIGYLDAAAVTDRVRVVATF
jgi:ABC-type phosphate transport system substrate-binding protein